MNDIPKAGIDDLMQSGVAPSQVDEKLVEMSNGCTCCTLRDDLLLEVRRLADKGRFDNLLIESTGKIEPLPVAAAFDFRDESGETLSDVARLDTIAAVVDAVHLLKDFSSRDLLSSCAQRLDSDERTPVNVLAEQIELADVVIINRVRDAGPERTDAARKIVRTLNGDAVVIETDRSAVDLDKIFNTGLFDFDCAHLHPQWAKELYGFTDDMAKTEDCAISSFVFRLSSFVFRLSSIMRADLLTRLLCIRCCMVP